MNIDRPTRNIRLKSSLHIFKMTFTGLGGKGGPGVETRLEPNIQHKKRPHITKGWCLKNHIIEN